MVFDFYFFSISGKMVFYGSSKVLNGGINKNPSYPSFKGAVASEFFLYF